ncbi:MAG: hypothetical protein ACTSYN_04530 [Candidatus Heimdallarchaeaceae archaeon]
MNEDSGRQKIKDWRKRELEEKQQTLNTITIIRMVVMLFSLPIPQSKLSLPSILAITTKATIIHLAVILFLHFLLVLGGSFTSALSKVPLTFN